jgi:hypothetical protein
MASMPDPITISTVRADGSYQPDLVVDVFGEIPHETIVVQAFPSGTGSWVSETLAITRAAVHPESLAALDLFHTACDAARAAAS